MKKFTLLALLTLLLLPFEMKAQDQLNLGRALELALEHNYDMRITHKREAIARKNNTQGAAGRYPSINLLGNSTNKYTKGDGNDMDQNLLTGGVGLDWVLFDGFSVNITKSRLEQLEKLSQGNTAVMVEGTMQAVILAYYRVLLEKERLRVVEQVMQLSKDRYKYEETRREIGSSVTYQVLQAQNSYLEDKGKFLLQEVNLKKAMRNLNFLLGEKEQKQWVLTDPFEAKSNQYNLVEMEEKMLQNNKNLRNQFINQVILEKDLALAKSQYMPTLSVRGGAEVINNRIEIEGNDPSTTNNWDYYGNLTLSYNLFNGGNRHRAVQIARINEGIGEVGLESLRHSLQNQLLNLYDFYEARKALLEVANEAVEAAELNMQISEEKFRTGAINSFNYRDVQLIYQNAALARLQAIINMIDADTSLLRITGGMVSE